jgi:hypothetical protein
LATRRKYRPSNHAPADVSVAVVAAPASPAGPQPPSQGDDASPLQRALEAQQHAEHLQRQHAQRRQIGLPEPELDPTQRQAIDRQIDAMPDLSDHKRRFLKSHPTLLSEPYRQSMAHAHHLALHAGVADDTLQMDHAILAGVARDIEHHRALSAANAQVPQHRDADHVAADLAREAEMHLAAHQPAPIAPQPQRRSMPMSAPVSRGSHDLGTGRSQSSTRITLSPDEVEIAHISFPHLPKAGAEYEYANNKRKYQTMKANGTYSDQGGG